MRLYIHRFSASVPFRLQSLCAHAWSADTYAGYTHQRPNARKGKVFSSRSFPSMMKDSSARGLNRTLDLLVMRITPNHWAPAMFQFDKYM